MTRLEPIARGALDVCPVRFLLFDAAGPLFCGVIGDFTDKMAGWYHSALLAKIAQRVGFRHAAGVQGANIDAGAQLLRAGARMLPEITDASCAAMGGHGPPLEITRRGLWRRRCRP